MGGTLQKNSGLRCGGTQGRWVQDWARILRARMCEHRMSVGAGVFKDRLSTSMPTPGSLWRGEQSKPPPPPPIGAAIHRPFPPALCRCLLQQCSDPTPPACSQIKGFPSPACALWFLGGKGQTSGEAQTCRRCNMGGFCPGYRGVDISGAGQSQNQGHRTELSMSCKHLAPAAFSLLASSVAWPQAWGGACMYLLAGSAYSSCWVK